LKDETGGRRFWPVECGHIEIETLKRDRDQLWAEARERFRCGARWWFDSEVLVEAAADEQQARYEGDAWDERIAKWIGGRETVSVSDVLEMCLQKKTENWARSDEMRISRILKSLGWNRYREPKDEQGNRLWRYRPGPNLRNLSQGRR